MKVREQPQAPRTEAALTWREKFAALRSVPQFLTLVWATHPVYATATIVLRVLRACVPICTLWIAKLILDAVVAARTGRPDATTLWTLVAVEMLLVLAGEALSKASVAIEGLFGDLCSARIGERTIGHAATLELSQLEDPAFYDHLERAQRQTTGRIGLLGQLLGTAQDLLTLVSLGVALTTFGPWLLILLVISLLPSLVGESHFAALEYALLYRFTPGRRELEYLRFLGASDRTAKEIQMFGLAGWLAGRYRRVAQRLYGENKQLAIRRGLASTGLSILGMLGYYGAYCVVLKRGYDGLISIGTLTFLVASFARSRDLAQRLLTSTGNIYEQGLYAKDLFDFFDLRPESMLLSPAREAPSELREGILFEDVGFRYPGQRHVGGAACQFPGSPG